MNEKIKLYIDDQLQNVMWESNEAVEQLEALLKESDIVVPMEKYSNNEQVGSLGQSLPSSDTQMNTVPGDIVLYDRSNIVVFYDTHSWSYTKLGKIIDKTEEELRALLGKSDVEVRLTLGH